MNKCRNSRLGFKSEIEKHMIIKIIMHIWTAATVLRILFISCARIVIEAASPAVNASTSTAIMIQCGCAQFKKPQHQFNDLPLEQKILSSSCCIKPFDLDTKLSGRVVFSPMTNRGA